MCGYCKVVATRLEENITIEHIDRPEETTLPRPDSKLYRCLLTLAVLRKATTLDVTTRLNHGKRKNKALTNSDVASQLTVLRYKGLVLAAVERKGVLGGSTWQLTSAAIKLLRVR
jgi:hypothetical protein